MKSSRTLTEQLSQRSVKDLLKIALLHDIQYSEGLSSSDCQKLVHIFESDSSWKALDADYYLDYADGGEIWEQIRSKILHSREFASAHPDYTFEDYQRIDEDHNELFPPEVCDYYEKNNRTGNQILLANAEKDSAAAIIAAHLLDAAVFEESIRSVSDISIDILRTAAQASAASPSSNDSTYGSAGADSPDLLPLPDSYWQDCSVDFYDRYSALRLESLGYVRYRRIPATVDTVEQIAAVEMVPEVAALFRRIDTDEFNQRRRYLYWLSECVTIAKDYYLMAPVDIIYKLMKVVHGSVPDMYLPPFGDEFISDVAEILPRIYDFMEVIEADGHSFIIEKLMNDLEDPDGFVEEQIYVYNEHDYNFYIPDFSEIAEYSIYGYWPSKEPWQRLHEWLMYFYLDEQTMSNMFSSMVNASQGSFDPDSPDYMKPPYSMDDVEDDAWEICQLLCLHLMTGGSIEDVIEEHPELTGMITEEAKRDLFDAVDDCARIVPRDYYMGFSDEAVEADA